MRSSLALNIGIQYRRAHALSMAPSPFMRPRFTHRVRRASTRRSLVRAADRGQGGPPGTRGVRSAPRNQ